MPTEFQRYRVLWPLVPAMAMVMIDFTIVSISASTIQSDLGLSETAVQWLVTAYALSTAAFVALGGRLGDILGHKRIVVSGVILFAGSSLMCGLVPDSGAIAVPWLVTFRVLQGVGAGLLIPSATVLVLDAFPPAERGKGLAVFFIVAGLFTAIGPVAGSYLTEFWTWRAIFWINVPVALFALIEFSFAKLNDIKRPSRVDWRGAFLIVTGMALTVLGIQQSTEWGWESPATVGSIVVGVIVLALFVAVERRTEDPLIDVNAMIANRPFAVDNLLTFLVFGPWLAVFFFGSMYFQIAVGQEPTEAGFSILTMFYSFFVAARIGGGWMDKFGPKRPVATRLPPRHDRDDRLGRRAGRTEPLGNAARDAADRRRLRARLLPAQHRRAEPAARLDARPGLGDRPDLPQLRLGAGHGDHGQHRRRRHRPDRRLRPAGLRRRDADRLLRGGGNARPRLHRRPAS